MEAQKWDDHLDEENSNLNTFTQNNLVDKLGHRSISNYEDKDQNGSDYPIPGHQNNWNDGTQLKHPT